MTLKSRIISLTRYYSAIPVLGISILVLYIFFSIGYQSILGPVLGGVMGSVVAIVALHVFNWKEQKTVDPSPIDYRVAVIIGCVYIISIFALYRVVSHEQHWFQYLFFGGYAAFVAYEISTGASPKRVVPQILVLCFFTYWSTQLAFPAGMYGPDTKGRYLPAIRLALESGYIRAPNLLIYLGHLVYVTETTVLTGLSAKVTYYLLATLVLTGTMLIISISNIAFPNISDQVVLFAALIFGCMSWTLGRGFHPNKLNFFYPLILLIGISVFAVFINYETTRRRWISIVILIAPALVFGHQFSAGAALIFLFAIGGFTVLAKTVFRGEYHLSGTSSVLLIVGTYLISILGNPLHQGPLLGRLVGLVNSLFVSSGGSGGAGGAGGPGRYSTIPLEVLLVNTTAQSLLFALVVLGAAISIRKSSWEFDFGIFWMGCLVGFLMISLVFNSADTQPQRFYSLLGLWGLNLFAGFSFKYIQNIRPSKAARTIVSAVVLLFVVFSLASPIAGIHLSPYNDQIPHNMKFDDERHTSGVEWVQAYNPAESRPIGSVPQSDPFPYRRINETTAIVNTSEIQDGRLYAYSYSASQTGIVVSGGLSLGSRVFVFMEFSPDPKTDVVYSNGYYSSYIQ